MNSESVKRNAVIMLIIISFLLCSCGSPKGNSSFKYFSKETTKEEISQLFGQEKDSYRTDYYEVIAYDDLTIAGILAYSPEFYFVPDTGTLMRIEFGCSYKGASRDSIDQMVKDLTKAYGKPTIEDKLLLKEYYTCYYWDSYESTFKCVAFLIDGDYVQVMLNYDWWFESLGL